MDQNAARRPASTRRLAAFVILFTALPPGRQPQSIDPRSALHQARSCLPATVNIAMSTVCAALRSVALANTNSGIELASVGQGRELRNMINALVLQNDQPCN